MAPQTAITVTMDAEALQQATMQALMGVLTPEMKDSLIQKAIQEIMKPQSKGYGSTKSVLELAFENGVERMCREEMIGILTADPALRERINALLRITADKVLSADQDKLTQRMADAFVQSLRRD